MTGHRQHLGVFVLAGLLTALGAAYQVRGNEALLGGAATGDAVDLRNRQQEQQLFDRGMDPFDTIAGSQPPWGYVVGFLLTWPAWPSVRTYFGAVNLAAVVFLMWWAGRQAPSRRASERLLLAAAVPAFGGACTATEVGQIGIVVTAFLAAGLWAGEKGREYLSGICIALSLVKPTIAVPFAVVLLLTGHYRAVTVVVVYVAAASLLSWAVTGATPLHMVAQMATGAASYVGDSTAGVMDLLAKVGLPPTAVTLVAPLLVTAPSVLLIAYLRHNLELCFAVASVWGRTWTYHKSYDDVMLVFLLIPLVLLALRRSRSWLPWTMFLITGAFLWVPGRILSMTSLQVVQLLSWFIALTFLLSVHRRLTAQTATGHVDGHAIFARQLE